MQINTAEYVISNTELKYCPAPDKPEYAFIGRSNVGKSSLINMLTNHKGLAKVSGKPGKTQTINHFLINDEWYLVDLPGYGYAKTSKSKRNLFKSFIHTYIRKRENLVALFVLVDSRLEPQKNDLQFMEWLGENQISFTLVFTKIDKLSSSELVKNLESYKRKLLVHWEALPPMILTSSTSKKGGDEILNFIDHNNPLWEQYYEQHH